MAWTLGVFPLALPTFLAILTPIPVVLLSADTLSPRPIVYRLHFYPHRRWSSRILMFAILLLPIVGGFMALASPRPQTDQPVVLTCAARDILHGVVPYTTYEPQCYLKTKYPALNGTPIATGPFANLTHYPSLSQVTSLLRHDERTGSHAGFPAFGYPPDAALLLLPVAFDGWLAVAAWTALLCLLLLAMIWWQPTPGKMLLITWQTLALSLSLIAFGWNPEYISYLLLALSFAIISHRRLSSVAMAAAACTNPLTWPVVPIYLAITHAQSDWRARWTWLFGSAIVGLAPWWIWDHSLPIQIWRFLTMPAFPIGAALGQLAHLPVANHHIYLAAFIAVIGIATVIAWFSERWRWFMAIAVYLAFIVSWRGPVYYYFPAFWLAPAILVGVCRLQGTHRTLRELDTQIVNLAP